MTQYFIINADHEIITGVTDVTYFSFTSRFVEATEQQLARYYALSEFLPEDTYLQLSDLAAPAKPKQAKTETKPTKPTKQRAEIEKHIRSLLQRRRK